MADIIAELKDLPHFRSFSCAVCGAEMRVHVLQIHGSCLQCGRQTKLRAFGGIGTELEDFIDAVLEWAGEGEAFDAVMRRRAGILADRDG